MRLTSLGIGAILIQVLATVLALGICPFTIEDLLTADRLSGGLLLMLFLSPIIISGVIWIILWAIFGNVLFCRAPKTYSKMGAPKGNATERFKGRWD